MIAGRTIVRSSVPHSLPTRVQELVELVHGVSNFPARKCVCACVSVCACACVSVCECVCACVCECVHVCECECECV